MARNIVLYAGLRVGSWLLPLVPLSLAYRVAVLIGNVAFHLFARQRRAIVENLAIALDLPESNPQVLSGARAAFRNDALNWVDTLRIGLISPRELERIIEVHGWEVLEQALAPGKGAILVSIHLGNFDLVGQLIAARGVPMTVPVERMKPAGLFDLSVKARESHGIKLVPVDRAPREMLAALRSGGLVAIAGDRLLGGRGVRACLFGRETVLPAGSVSLARHTGAPLLFGFGTRRAEGGYKAFIGPFVPITYTANHASDDRENVQRLAKLIEGAIRQFPDQWLAFWPLWPKSTGAGEEPMERGQEVAV